jgi:hypothetical protein
VGASTIVYFFDLSKTYVVGDGKNIEVTDSELSRLIPRSAVELDGLTSRWTMAFWPGRTEQTATARAAKHETFSVDDDLSDVGGEHVPDHKHISKKRNVDCAPLHRAYVAGP